MKLTAASDIASGNKTVKLKSGDETDTMDITVTVRKDLSEATFSFENQTQAYGQNATDISSLASPDGLSLTYSLSSSSTENTAGTATNATAAGTTYYIWATLASDDDTNHYAKGSVYTQKTYTVTTAEIGNSSAFTKTAVSDNSVTLSVSLAKANNSDSADVALPSGTVVFSYSTDNESNWTEIGTENVAGGLASISAPAASGNIYTYKAVYSGDTNYKTKTFESLSLDVQAPTVTKTFAANGANAGKITVESSEAGAAYYVVVPASDTTTAFASADELVTAAQGTGSYTAKGKETLTANSSKDIAISGLTGDTEYKAFLTVADEADNYTDILTGAFTTDGAASDATVAITNETNNGNYAYGETLTATVTDGSKNFASKDIVFTWTVTSADGKSVLHTTSETKTARTDGGSNVTSTFAISNGAWIDAKISVSVKVATFTAVPATSDVTVTKRIVTAAYDSGEVSKVYDGDATITAANVTGNTLVLKLNNVYGTDDIALDTSKITYAFGNSGVSDTVSVTASDLALDASKTTASYYTLNNVTSASLGNVGKITQANRKISWNDASLSKAYGAADFTPQYTVSTDADSSASGATKTYSSTNTAVATISDAGLVNVKGVGETTLKVEIAATTNYKKAEATVVLTVSKADVGTKTLAVSNDGTKTEVEVTLTLGKATGANASIAFPTAGAESTDGSVQFYCSTDNGTTWTAFGAKVTTMTDGVATYTGDVQTGAVYIFKAGYTGDANYNAATVTNNSDKADLAAPSVTDVYTATGTDAATLSYTSDRDGTVYYVVTDDATTSFADANAIVTASSVTSGTYTANGTEELTKDTPATISLSDLTQDTKYYVFAAVANKTGSHTVVTGDVTTNGNASSAEVAIMGTATYGSELTATVTNATSIEALAITYTWKNGNTVLATHTKDAGVLTDTYTVGKGLAGKTITVSIKAEGYTAVTSTATSAVKPATITLSDIGSGIYVAGTNDWAEITVASGLIGSDTASDAISSMTISATGNNGTALSETDYTTLVGTPIASDYKGDYSVAVALGADYSFDGTNAGGTSTVTFSVTADTTPPVINSVSFTPSTNAVSIKIASSEAGTYYFVLTDTEVTTEQKQAFAAASLEQKIELLQSYSKLYGYEPASALEVTATVSELAEGTSYYLYMVLADGAGNVSDLKEGSFKTGTTPATVTPPATSNTTPSTPSTTPSTDPQPVVVDNGDGTSTSTTSKTNADGSVTETATTTDANGNTLSKTETTTSTTTDTATGATTETEKAVTTDASGNVTSTTESTTVTNVDGSSESTTAVTNADGSGEVSQTVTETTGASTSSTVTTDSTGAATEVSTTTVNANGKTTEAEYDVTSGKNITLETVETTTNKIAIPATVKAADGKTYKVTAIAKNTFKGDKKLKTITLKGGKVTSIGKGAFSGIAKKATIKINGTAKQMKKITKLIKKSGVAKTVKIKKA